MNNSSMLLHMVWPSNTLYVNILWTAWILISSLICSRNKILIVVSIKFQLSIQKSIFTCFFYSLCMYFVITKQTYNVSYSIRKRKSFRLVLHSLNYSVIKLGILQNKRRMPKISKTSKENAPLKFIVIWPSFMGDFVVMPRNLK